jgi:hypothetical protein
MKKINIIGVIKRFCEYHDIVNYFINEDYSIDIFDNVNLIKPIKKLPVKIKICASDFICKQNELITLKNFPSGVIKNINISYNKLKYLKGLPKEVYGDLLCNNNMLTTLEYCSDIIQGDFDCSGNKLTDLKYSPSFVKENYICEFNKLKSLFGVPEKINKDFSCSYNELETLQYAPKYVAGDFSCGNNPLTNLKYIPEKIGDTLRLNFLHKLKNVDDLLNIQYKEIDYQYNDYHITKMFNNILEIKKKLES